MAGFSDTAENQTLDHWFRNVAVPSPVTVYVSLHSSDPGDTGVGEITGGSYARQVGTFGAASGGTISTTADTQFDDLPAATISHVGIWDAASGGNYIAGGPLNSPKSVGAGDSLRISSSDLTVTLD